MSMRHISHALSDEFHAATKGDRTLNSLLPILGPPQMSTEFNVEDRLSHERWPVEKLYEGRSVYLENTLSTMVKRTFNPWVTQYIMPLREYADINFSWEKHHANRTLAPQTAVGAPPERVTQTRSIEHATMNRYELGFIVNSETLDNPEGQFALALDIVNVAMAIGDTFEQLGLTALLQRKNYWRERLRKFHEPYSNASDIFSEEKAMWDILRKQPDGRGFYTLVEEVRKRQLEIISSDVILAQGSKSLIAAGSGNQDYYIYGEGARANVERGADGVGRTTAGLRIHVVREITIDHDGLRVAPLHRIRSIGDHFRLEDYNTNCNPAEYRSCARTVKVFDMSESRGVFKPVDFMDAMTHAGRFTPDGDLVEAHSVLAKSATSYIRRARLPLAPGGFIDMFLHFQGDEYNVCEILGQMDKQALSMQSIRLTAESIVAHGDVNFFNDIGKYVRTGVKLIANIYSSEVTEDQANAAKNQLSAANLNQETGILSGNEWGTHNLPTKAPVDKEEYGNYLPFGYGSVSGLFTIATMRRNTEMAAAIGAETIQTAIKFKESVEELYDALAPLFDSSHIAFSGDRVPQHFASSHPATNAVGRRNNQLIAFAQNLIDTAKAPLYLASSASMAPAANLSGNLAPVANVEADEQAVLSATRQALHDNATPLVASIFATATSIAAFRKEYETSAFSMSYLRYRVDQSADATEKKELRGNRSFALFANEQLRNAVTSGHEAVTNLMHGVVNAVRQDKSISARNMESALANMIASPVTLSSSSSSSSSSSAHVSDNVPIMTRLTHSPAMLARASPNVREMFAPASFHDTSVMVNLNDRRAVNQEETAVAQSGAVALFPHSASGPSFVYNTTTSTVGRKRKNNSISGVLAIGAFPQALQAAAQGYLSSDNLETRVNALNGIGSDVLRIAAIALLLAPIKYGTFAKFYDNDIRVPLSILGERPLRLYETASAIFAAGGENGELGEIAWAKFNVHLSSNAMTKDFEGNVSIWAAPIVKREERYYIAEDVTTTGYLGGESLKPFSPDTFNPATLYNSAASVFFFLEPAGSLRGPNAVSRTHDIRGRYDDALVEGRLNQSARIASTETPHHASALFYNVLYKFHEMRTGGVDDADYFKIDGRRDNTITHQTMQWMWNSKTGEWDRPILNTDHFGVNIYEGHGDLRVSGRSELYKDAGYLGKYPPID